MLKEDVKEQSKFSNVFSMSKAAAAIATNGEEVGTLFLARIWERLDSFSTS